MEGYCSQPSHRSAELLRSLPNEILVSILDLFLADELYTGKRGATWEAQSCRIMNLSTVIEATKQVRSVCTSWSDATRSLVFRRKFSRANLILKLPRLLTEEDVALFPMLRDCMVELCYPYSFHLLYSTLYDLYEVEHSLEYVSFITWEEDTVTDAMTGSVSGFEYFGMGSELMKKFETECIKTGLKLATGQNKRPNGGTEADSLRLKEEGIDAMVKFFYKELLALWYYNAHYVRQILSPFPSLEYFVLPDFLHIPLLAKKEFFFPTLTDDSLFAPVTSSPCYIQSTSHKDNYQEGAGRSYADLMGSAKSVRVQSSHCNPIRSRISQTSRNVPSFSLSFMVFNRWTDGILFDLGEDIFELIAAQLDKAVTDSALSGKCTFFD
ncbi:hypothetical protein BJY04DRAFT_53994 [Aspergillus karnatakaensis]|uniref:uncharacterized protein n=1 Tax=Aspergillus karnatakaensis TaxID=1810916 RepID=UPI003CCD626A